ncbi:hypothetical protein [Isoptericola sp. NPDC057559]|uniref:hypothetical protein n=1 Tax=Isoptericola sp. NPDC057559 TaxID=3346168 RepID=UPI0036AC35C5
MSELPTNDAVTWSGTRFGLLPAVDASEPLDEATLLDLLDDPDRFVLAHVLLTLRSGVSYSALEGGYNGLAVDLRPDGEVEVAPGQGPALRRRWAAWAASRPRPGTLPPDPGASAP